MNTGALKGNSPKRKRRWFQFSLRSLLVFVLIIAIPCAWLGKTIQQKRRERDAVETILKLGGKVTYDFQTVKGAPPPGPEWLRNLFGDNLFSEVINVEFEGGIGVTDAQLKVVEDLTHLQRLSVVEAQITDAGLVSLEGLIQLQTLKLNGTNVTDAGLTHFKGLTALKTLDLTGTNITDVGLVQLKRFRQLRSLNLIETSVTDAGLLDLESLIQLESLNLGATNVTNIGREYIKMSLPNCTIW